ncbi:hypothetical protein OsccyDRAFT_1599 [Leptolyngbyaceae cyanobacterium JSC-12]|nr:hypothetical protein OsccyDRAFT_1599 [Leptolyngbyaceae cyanobacterium JSC-12]
MNSFPEDDHQLSKFLQQNRPTVPPAAADLEERILAIIEETPQEMATPERSRQRSRTFRHRGMWLLPSALAAGFVATVVGYQFLIPRQPTEAELAELETFIETTWQGNLAEQPTSESEELIPLLDEPLVN